jgi:Uncharacterised protein family (UPF0175)
VTITIELPDDVAGHPDPAREALEALVLEGYRTRKWTQFEAGRMLGLSRIETEDFLAAHIDLYDYPAAELEAEADVLDRLQP